MARNPSAIIYISLRLLKCPPEGQPRTPTVKKKQIFKVSSRCSKFLGEKGGF